MGGQGAVPIKHYPTINWNKFEVLLNFLRATIVPIKHYPTINWNFTRLNNSVTVNSVPIKHYPTINWNLISAVKKLVIKDVFQLNTIQRLTETKPDRHISKQALTSSN